MDEAMSAVDNIRVLEVCSGFSTRRGFHYNVGTEGLLSVRRPLSHLRPATFHSPCIQSKSICQAVHTSPRDIDTNFNIWYTLTRVTDLQYLANFIVYHTMSSNATHSEHTFLGEYICSLFVLLPTPFYTHRVHCGSALTNEVFGCQCSIAFHISAKVSFETRAKAQILISLLSIHRHRNEASLSAHETPNLALKSSM